MAFELNHLSLQRRSGKKREEKPQYAVLVWSALQFVVVDYVLRYYKGPRAVVRKVPAAVLVS